MHVDAKHMKEGYLKALDHPKRNTKRKPNVHKFDYVIKSSNLVDYIYIGIMPLIANDAIHPFAVGTLPQIV